MTPADRNPELRRNLWLDVTRRRMAFAGAILAGVFVAVWLVDRGRHAYAVVLAGAAVFLLAGLVWAPRAARASVTDEARAGTWDFQRLGAQGPASLAWGKLAGATARPWVFASGGLALTALQLASTSSVTHAGFWVLTAVALAATLQACGLASGLADVRRARVSGRPLSARAPGLFLLTLGLLAVAALVWARARFGREAARLPFAPQSLGPPVVWWAGHAAPWLGFAALSLIGFAAWAWVWAWRSMRLELQYAARPWVFASFLAFVGVYAFGFDPPVLAKDPLAARLTAASAALAVLAYLCAVIEPADRVQARRLAAAAGAGDADRVMAGLPAFAWAGAACGLGCAMLAILWLRDGEPATAVMALAVFVFLLRDLGLIAWRRFAGAGDVGALAPIVLLYALGAALAVLPGGGRTTLLLLPGMAHPRVGLMVAGLEAAAAWLLAARSLLRPIPRPWAWTPPPDEAEPSPHDASQDPDDPAASIATSPLEPEVRPVSPPSPEPRPPVGS